MSYELLDTCLLVPGIGSAACASWVQAWGSIGAILAAVWIGSRQLRTARRLDAEARYRSDLLKLEVLYSLFGDANGQVRMLADATQPQASVDRPLQRLNEIREALMGVPLFDAPTRLMCFATLEGPRAIYDLCQAVGEVRGAWDRAHIGGAGLPPEETLREFRRAFGHAQGVFSAAEENSKKQIEDVRKLLPHDEHLHPDWFRADDSRDV